MLVVDIGVYWLFNLILDLFVKWLFCGIWWEWKVWIWFVVNFKVLICLLEYVVCVLLSLVFVNFIFELVLEMWLNFFVYVLMVLLLLVLILEMICVVVVLIFLLVFCFRESNVLNWVEKFLLFECNCFIWWCIFIFF